jgi:hypothetical protein
LWFHEREKERRHYACAQNVIKILQQLSFYVEMVWLLSLFLVPL